MTRLFALASGSALLLASCSCATAHELDGGSTVPDVDSGPPLFPMCGNPIAPQPCSSDEVCRAWAASFGVAGEVETRCWPLRNGDGSARIPSSICTVGTACIDGNQATCICTPTVACALGEMCVRDPAGGASRCVAGCADLNRCYDLRIVDAASGLPPFAQPGYCPTDGGAPDASP